MLKRAAPRYIKAWGQGEYTVMGILLPQPEGEKILPVNGCICEMEADAVCLFTSQVWCTAAFVMRGWKDLQDTSVFPKLKLLVWMKLMKTDAFLGLKCGKHCFFSLTWNHNASFQKDALELGCCQASSKVSYLTRRGYGIERSTRCTVQEKN